MAKNIGVTMEVGNDGVAVITISNPPVNSLASPSNKRKSLLSSTSPSLDYDPESISFSYLWFVEFFSYFWVEGEVS